MTESNKVAIAESSPVKMSFSLIKTFYLQKEFSPKAQPL